MAKGNLTACLSFMLPHEGGYTNDSRDPGNWTGGKVGKGVLKGTKYGIAANTHPNLDIKNLTIGDAEAIYRREYWNVIMGESLPYGVDLATFDPAVNSGPGRALRWLQAAIGAKADGKAGAETILKASKADGKKTIQAIYAARLPFMKSLAIWKTYKNGWSRRLAEGEAKAVTMWLTKGGPIDAHTTRVLKEEAGKAEDKAAQQKTQAGGTAGAGGVAGGGDALINGDPNWLLIGGIAAAVVVVAVLLVVHSRKNSERALAYSAAAAG